MVKLLPEALPEMFNHIFTVRKPWTLVRTKDIASTIWIEPSNRSRKYSRVLSFLGAVLCSIRLIHICYSPAGRAVLGKTVPEVSSTARGRRPKAVLETEGTVFPNTDRPRPVNNIFIYF